MKIQLREQIIAAVFAAVIGVMSQVTIPMGPIPLTLQTFIIGLVVTILGTRTGTWAIIIYLLLGLIGLPVYAGGSAGVSALLGPTGGFLIGFIFNGLVTGLLIEKTKATYFWAILANLVGAAVTLAFGAAWLKFSGDMSFVAAFKAAVLPFIIPGIIKAVAAALIGILIKERLPERLLAPTK